jgi:2-isopropylmalate synthase
VSVSTTAAESGQTSLSAHAVANGLIETITGEGNGPVSAFVDAISTLGHRIRVLDYTEHAYVCGW